jgi:hypothetical protein
LEKQGGVDVNYVKLGEVVIGDKYVINPTSFGIATASDRLFKSYPCFKSKEFLMNQNLMATQYHI